MYLPIAGCNDDFPDCPAAYLRTSAEVQEISDRRGVHAFDDHLIEGSIHPATLVGPAAYEVETGSRSVESLSPKMQTLVHVWINQKAARDAHRMESRREQRH
jgi:hypothetical protein